MLCLGDYVANLVQEEKGDAIQQLMLAGYYSQFPGNLGERFGDSEDIQDLLERLPQIQVQYEGTGRGANG